MSTVKQQGHFIFSSANSWLKLDVLNRTLSTMPSARRFTRPGGRFPKGEPGEKLQQRSLHIFHINTLTALFWCFRDSPLSVLVDNLISLLCRVVICLGILPADLCVQHLKIRRVQISVTIPPMSLIGADVVTCLSACMIPCVAGARDC